MDDAIVVANRLRIAQDASVRYGWPLHVFENCADDPPASPTAHVHGGATCDAWHREGAAGHCLIQRRLP
jgi:hypothetical protein